MRTVSPARYNAPVALRSASSVDVTAGQPPPVPIYGVLAQPMSFADALTWLAPEPVFAGAGTAGSAAA